MANWKRVQGRMFYGNNWAFLQLEDDIIAYYQWFLKRRYHGGLKLHQPKAGAHVTVVRGAEQDPVAPEYKELFWKKYDGMVFDFQIDTENIGFNGEYFWFDCICPEMMPLRTELGLSSSPRYGFHLTIGKLYPEDVQNFQTFLHLGHEFLID